MCLWADFPTREVAEAFYEFEVRETASALAGDVDDDGDPLVPFPVCDIQDIADGVPGRVQTLGKPRAGGGVIAVTELPTREEMFA